MNVLELEPVKSGGGDCFDDVIVTLSNWFGRDYELMYADVLKFYFNPQASQTIGARMKTDLTNALDSLQHYHGYSIRVYRTLSPDNGLTIIREQLSKGNPISLNLDTYYSPWDTKFLTAHFYTHVMLVTGIDPATNDLFCTDPFFAKKQMRLPYENYKDGILGCMTTEPNDTGFPNNELLLASLCDKIREHLEITPQSFQDWAEALLSVDFDKEAEDSANFMESPFYMRLTTMVLARSNYVKMLDYVANRCDLPRLRDFMDEIKQMANKWNSLRGLIAKMSCMPRTSIDAKMRDNVYKKVLATAELETTLLERLLHTLQPGAAETLPNSAAAPAPNESVHQVMPVDLRNQVNTRGINNERGTADFDADGHSYARNGIPESNQLRVADMSFTFPAPHDDFFDNVSCMGQTVSLQPGSYLGLMVLGCSQFSPTLDTFTIVYTDGSSEQVPIGFADWWNPVPINGERVAWQANLVRGQTVLPDNQVYIYAKKAVLSSPKIAENLILPIMPNLHVFAVSMWK
jgi:hypothetical protein